jgi:hypothetical protein
MDHCRFCKINSNLIKAHIIPEAFFRELRHNNNPPLLVSGREGDFKKKAPIGVYDTKILCPSCEAKFMLTDNYGVNAILTNFKKLFKPIHKKTEIIAFQSELVDKEKLLEFLVSILWRASVSLHPFYAKVNLGQHEETAKNVLFSKYQKLADTFDAVLSRWDDADDHSLPTKALLNPHAEQWNDIHAYRVYLGKIIAYIKVDKRPFTEPLSLLSLRSSAPCLIVNRTLSTSKDLAAMRKTVITAENNHNRFRLT